MEVKKINFMISSMDELWSSSFKNRFLLSHSFLEKGYEINQIYGVFTSNHSFVFAKEGIVCCEEWEEMREDQLPCYELIHKQKFQLLNTFDSKFLTDSYEQAPWHAEEMFQIAGEYAVPIEARKLVPQSFIKENRISYHDLEKVKTAIIRILEETPELVDQYFERGMIVPKTA